MGVPAPRISPVPPSPSLLSSARQLPGNLDWERGIEWATGCYDSFVKEFCPASPTLDVAADGTFVHTHPFTIYTPIVCDVTTVEMGDVEARATEITDAHTAYHLARALWMGDGLPPGDVDDEYPTLRRSAVALNQADAVDLDDGVAALLAEYEQCSGGQGGALIHLPSLMVPFALGGGSGGARVCWPEGTFYRGPLGSVVVPGPGYPFGSSPDGPDGYGPLTGTGPDAYEGNAADEVWVYITGPVEYALTEVRAMPESEQDRLVNFTNRYEVWGMREAIVRFDPCCAFAVLVNNPVPTSEVS